MPVSTHVLEPGLDLNPPRKVRIRGGLVVLVAAAILLVTILFAFGAASIFEAGRLIWLARSGTSTKAAVTGLYYGAHRELAFDGARAQQISGFEYRFTTTSGRTIVARTPVELSRSLLNQRSYVLVTPGQAPKQATPPVPKLQYVPGQSLTIRYATFDGHVFSRPWDRAPSAHTVYLLITGTILLAIATMIGLNVQRRIIAAYHLVRHGLITVGIVRAKNAVNEDTLRYYITFAEMPSSRKRSKESAREWTRPCSAQQFLTFVPDQKVTLIAPPGKPDETTLFRLLPFGR